jgi:hypothetical protein
LAANRDWRFQANLIGHCFPHIRRPLDLPLDVFDACLADAKLICPAAFAARRADPRQRVLARLRESMSDVRPRGSMLPPIWIED